MPSLRTTCRWVAAILSFMIAGLGLYFFVDIQRSRYTTIRLIEETRGRVICHRPFYSRTLNWCIRKIYGHDLIQGPISHAHIGSTPNVALVLVRLENETELDTLSIEDAQESEIPATPFLAWRQLKTLSLSNGNAAQLILALPSDLYGLSLNKANVDDRAMLGLAHVKRFEFLSLKDNPVTDSSLTVLAGKDIETLDLSGTHITDEASSSISSIADLRSLLINRTRISSQFVISLGPLPVLESFSAYGTSIDDEGVCEIARAWHLKTLVIHDAHTSRRSLQCIRLMNDLSSISIDSQGMDEQLVSEFVAHPSLIYLSFNPQPFEELRVDVSKLLNSGKMVGIISSGNGEYTERWIK